MLKKKSDLAELLFKHLYCEFFYNKYFYILYAWGVVPAGLV